MYSKRSYWSHKRPAANFKKLHMYMYKVYIVDVHTLFVVHCRIEFVNIPKDTVPTSTIGLWPRVLRPRPRPPDPVKTRPPKYLPPHLRYTSHGLLSHWKHHTDPTIPLPPILTLVAHIVRGHLITLSSRIPLSWTPPIPTKTPPTSYRGTTRMVSRKQASTRPIANSPCLSPPPLSSPLPLVPLCL